MSPKANLILQNGALMSFCIGAIGWLFVTVIITGKYLHLNALLSLLSMATGIAGIVVIAKLLYSEMAVSQQRLDLSRAVWRHSVETFPILGLLRGSWTFIHFGLLVMGIGIMALSLRFGYYLLATDISPTALLLTPECMMLQLCLEPNIIVPAMSIAFLGTASHLAVLAELSRRWRRTVQLSGDNQSTFDALDRLTTLEQWQHKTAKADSYSRNLLALAERL